MSCKMHTKLIQLFWVESDYGFLIQIENTRSHIHIIQVALSGEKVETPGLDHCSTLSL